MPRTFVSRGAKCQTHTCTARRDLAFKLDGRCATVQAAQRHCSSTTPEQHAAERCRSVLTAYAASCIMITMITAASDAVGEARPCVRFDGSATFIRDCAYVKAPPSACVCVPLSYGSLRLRACVLLPTPDVRTNPAGAGVSRTACCCQYRSWERTPPVLGVAALRVPLSHGSHQVVSSSLLS